ncbi:MAG: hypothetical protein Q9M15_01490 [Mariprofundaceae bacterium]|nr:hypothetical protein [Mariprofundaceae bacterium]
MTPQQAHVSIGSMDTQENQQQIESRITTLQAHLSTIAQHLDKVITENKRLREVVRLAESELRKRRDRVQNLEQKLENLQTNDTENFANNESNHGAS